MPNTVTPFLMFTGQAEEAMACYVSVFAGSEIVSIDRYGAGEAGPEGSVRLAELMLAGQPVKCIDSPVAHAFTFTPSFSLFVECESEAELGMAYQRLSEAGATLMPPDNYGFSQRFAWLTDRFGVSWQLNWSGSSSG